MRIGQKLSIPIAIVAIGNLTNIFYRNYGIDYYIFYVILFIPIIAIFLIVKKELKRKTISIIFLFLSLVGFWFGGDSSLIGTTFLMFSIYLSQEKKSILIYLALAALSIIVNFTITNQNPAQMAVYLAGSSVILITYQHYIHPKKAILQNISGFTDDHMEILQGMIDGKKPKEIADEICLSPSTVREKQMEMRKSTGTATNEQLIFYLATNGYLLQISKKTTVLFHNKKPYGKI